MAASIAAAQLRQRQALGRLLAALGLRDPALAADRLLDEFGNLGRVLAGDPNRVRTLTRSHEAADGLRTVRETMLQSLADDLCDRPLIASSDALAAYVRAHIGSAPVELVRVLFLDARLHLLRDELMFRGTIAEAPIYPREIVRRALELGAAGLVVVHNHPSGDPTPSSADVERTANLRQAAALFDLHLVDHVIVSDFGCHSMRSSGAL